MPDYTNNYPGIPFKRMSKSKICSILLKKGMFENMIYCSKEILTEKCYLAAGETKI